MASASTEKQQITTNPGCSRTVVATLVVLSLFAFAIPIVTHWLASRTFQKTTSPDGLHTAELTRFDHLDRNYSIFVDGKRVYSSPDFAPRQDLPFREALLWDDAGKVIVFEVAGHRIFGYDVRAQRQLTDEELLSLKVVEPPLDAYGFESEWPGIGRAQQLLPAEKAAHEVGTNGRGDVLAP